MSAEYFDLEMFYGLFIMLYTILMIIEVNIYINYFNQVGELSLLCKFVIMLTLLGFLESLFGALYWYKMNEEINHVDHWSFIVLMII